MVRRRIIPKLLLKKSEYLKGKSILITTTHYSNDVEVGNPISQAKIFEAQAADELLFVDVEASAQNRLVDIEIIRKAASEIFMPITVGGGVKSCNDIKLLLANGADKVCLNEAICQRPELLKEASFHFGASTVVASIDYQTMPNGERIVVFQRGKIKTPFKLLEWAETCEALGAGEIFISAIDRDGTRKGLDIDGIRLVSEKVSIPVVASGGCGIAQHFVEGFLATGISGIAAGTYFAFRDENLMQVRSQIKNAGISIRLLT